MNCLMISCYGNNKLEIIKYLAQFVENYNITDNNGENCLILACYQNVNIKTLNFLITDLNLNVNHRDKYAESCLVRLCEKCADLEIIKSMIEIYGANPLDRDVDGNNCLGILLKNANESFDYPSLKIVKYMIEVQKIIEYFVKKHIIGIDDMKFTNTEIIIEYYKNNHKELRKYFSRKNSKYSHWYDSNIIDYIKKYLNPFIFSIHTLKFFCIEDPYDLPYDIFCQIVDDLKINGRFNIPKKVVFVKKNNKNDSDESNKKNNYGQLFIHNGKKYFGNCNRVFTKMLLFCDNKFDDANYLDFTNEFVLEGSLPDYAVNFYINTCYASKYNLSKIIPSDFCKFIQFIDQYPNQILSIENMKNQLITYFNKYGSLILSDDWISMVQIFNKYKIKELYMCIHNAMIKNEK